MAGGPQDRTVEWEHEPDGHKLVSFPSRDGRSTCRGDLWLPRGEPRCVVQLAHGMVEHLLRYRDLAGALTAEGMAVCGIDHIGHGRTCPDPAERGVYDPDTGYSSIVEDQHVLRRAMQSRFGDAPYVLLGHSMGSFVTRCYIGRHGDGLAGAIVMGTAWQPSAVLASGRALARAIGRARGWDHRSDLLDSLGVGGYNKSFEGTGARTGYEWLSRDPQRALDYAADPDSGWQFSVSGYYTLFRLLDEAEDPRAIARVPKDLPVLVVSGGDDPVGERGRGPEATARALRDAGVRDVELRIYEGARHELLGETNRDEVVRDLLSWIGTHALA